MSTTVPFREFKMKPRVRLLCFPFAGAGAVVYRGWGALFGEHVEVCPIEIPGRGTRFNESALEEMTTLRDCVLEEIKPLLDLPVALFGHSMGGKLAFELSKCLGANAVHLFVSAASAPDTTRARRIANLPHAAFIEELRRLGGTPEEILADADLLELLIPVLRADFRVVETYRASDSACAPCGLTVLAGTRDAEVSLANARGWEAFAGGPYRMATVDAGHLYLAHERAFVAREIARDLASLGYSAST